jgi:Flp pilus assembly protein TadG
MRRYLCNLIARLVHDTDASEVAEAAFVLPIMFTILLGIFWFGQAFSIYGTVARIAQDAALAGAEPACATCTQGTVSINVYNAIQNEIAATNLNINNFQQPTTTPVYYSCKDGSVKLCDSSPGNVCVQESIQLSNTALGGAGVCGISVTFQYQYSSWLPFTTLNKRGILINAAAEVPMETR